MSKQWVLVGAFDAAVGLLALVAAARRRRDHAGPTGHRDDTDSTRTTGAADRAATARRPQQASVLVIGPHAGTSVEAAATAAALRAANSRPHTTVASLAGASEPDATNSAATLEAIRAADLVVITHGGEVAQRYVSCAVERETAHIVHTPLVDDLDTFEGLRARCRADGICAIDVALGGSAALSRAVHALIHDGERICEIELVATVPAGRAHYDALDGLLLSTAVTAPDSGPENWRLTVATGARETQSGIITTDLRKIDWVHDGEIGIATAALTVTSEVETSTEVRIRIDPVQQFQRAIGAALDEPLGAEPYLLTSTLLNARRRWWAI